MSKRRPTDDTIQPGAAAVDDVVPRLRRHLTFLGLTHTLGNLDDLLARELKDRLGPTALLERVLGEEAGRKLEQRITRRIDGSGLREHKVLEAFDWNFQPALDKGVVLELARLDFVRRHDDLVITGKSGTGKSHILMALARRACDSD